MDPTDYHYLNVTIYPNSCYLRDYHNNIGLLKLQGCFTNVDNNQRYIYRQLSTVYLTTGMFEVKQISLRERILLST